MKSSVTITFHGHACFTLDGDGHRLVFDPFLTGNPAADISVDRLARVDAVLLSHGHGDHLGDAIPIATRGGATPRTVIPMHYNTGDVIKADPEGFTRRVGARSQVVVLRPGQSHTLA